MHNSSLPPMEALAALLAAADAGSFTAAAEALGVTHASVSRRVATLETWLGTPVFERRGRGVKLTPAGQRFAAEARQALELLSRSADQWRPWRGRQTVRLSVVPSFAKLWLLSRVPELERDDIRIELAMDHRVSDLDAREADIAIRYGAGRWDGVDATLLMRETLQAVAAPRIAHKLGVRAKAGAVLAHPLIHDSDVRQWREWLSAEGVRYQARWQDRRFEDYDVVLAAAEAGMGVVLARLPLAQPWLDDGRLLRVAPRRLANPLAHFVCVRAGENRDPVRALCQRIVEAG